MANTKKFKNPVLLQIRIEKELKENLLEVTDSLTNYVTKAILKKLNSDKEISKLQANKMANNIYNANFALHGIGHFSVEFEDIKKVLLSSSISEEECCSCYRDLRDKAGL